MLAELSEGFVAVTPMPLSVDTGSMSRCCSGCWELTLHPRATKPRFSIKSFKALGLQSDLNKVDEGCFTLDHTDLRGQELLEQIETMIEGRDAWSAPKNSKGCMDVSFGSTPLSSVAPEGRGECEFNVF